MVAPIYSEGVGLKALLRSEIRGAVESFCREPTQRLAILDVLSRPGYPLHEEASCRAGVLTLEIYQSLSDRTAAPASKAGAAVELQMVAAYLFDNVADDEIEPEYGVSSSEELALAIGLLSCGSATASEAVREAEVETAEVSLTKFHANYITACAGQHLDALFEKAASVSIDDALRMTSLKSGGLGRFAAEFGAGIAIKDEEVINLAGDFGFNLFTYLQLVDDLRDACPEQGLSRDLSQNKKTLPLVFFYNSLYGQLELSGASQEYTASGAPVFGAIVAEAFLNRTKTKLRELQGVVGTVKRLERLITTVEICSPELEAFA